MKSNHSLCAKAIKQELKKKFPKTKFSVVSDSFSCGTSVRISWENGPTSLQVSSITCKYQYGRFDGMNDCYDYSNINDSIPQTKYVQHSRNIDESVFDKIFQYLKEKYHYFDKIKHLDETSQELQNYWSSWTARQYIYRIIHKFDLTNGIENINISS